jgi:hypothetical protein
VQAAECNQEHNHKHVGRGSVSGVFRAMVRSMDQYMPRCVAPHRGGVVDRCGRAVQRERATLLLAHLPPPAAAAPPCCLLWHHCMML